MPDIPRAAATQFGAFTRAQAVSAGWSRSAIENALARDRIQALRRGVYVQTDVMQGNCALAARRHLAARSAAAVLVHTGSAASHHSAAVLAGLPLLTTPRVPCLTVAPSSRAVSAGIDLHRARLIRPEDVVRSASIERTASSRTITDIARESGIEEAVVVGDTALARGFSDAVQLERELERCSHWPGISTARKAVALCDKRSESPLESISRLRVADLRLPAPQLQTEIIDLDGRFLGRVDFYWDQYGVVGEADGMEKYDDIASQPLRREKRRQRLLEDAGLLVVRWGWEDLRNLPKFRAHISRELARGARRSEADRRWRARFA